MRQIEFEMREIVLLGPARWVRETADVIAPRHRVARARDGARWRVARRRGSVLPARGRRKGAAAAAAEGQARISAARRHGGLALASVNRHGTFFGQRFHITTADGEPVHTACIAVGLDRWSHAARQPAKRSLMRHRQDRRCGDDLRRLSFDGRDAAMEPRLRHRLGRRSTRNWPSDTGACSSACGTPR